jgi:heme exporter protein C
MRKNWWKVLAVALVLYAIVAGLLWDVPRKSILNESIRNLYYHVPMWFGMVILLLISAVNAIKYLSKGEIKYDVASSEYANIGILYSVLGMITGMVWAKYTWGAPWSNDPKQLATAVSMLTYMAYLVLRGGIEDPDKKAKISAVFNVFAFCLMIPLLFVLPRMTDSLHPGNGGNPGFNSYDLDASMRIVFYPAVLGWTLLACWIATIGIRIRLINIKREDI